MPLDLRSYAGGKEERQVTMTRKGPWHGKQKQIKPLILGLFYGEYFFLDLLLKKDI